MANTGQVTITKDKENLSTIESFHITWCSFQPGKDIGLSGIFLSFSFLFLYLLLSFPFSSFSPPPSYLLFSLPLLFLLVPSGALPIQPTEPPFYRVSFFLLLYIGDPPFPFPLPPPFPLSQPKFISPLRSIPSFFPSPPLLALLPLSLSSSSLLPFFLLHIIMFHEVYAPFTFTNIAPPSPLPLILPILLPR